MTYLGYCPARESGYVTQSNPMCHPMCHPMCQRTSKMKDDTTRYGTTAAFTSILAIGVPAEISKSGAT